MLVEKNCLLVQPKGAGEVPWLRDQPEWPTWDRLDTKAVIMAPKASREQESSTPIESDTVQSIDTVIVLFSPCPSPSRMGSTRCHW